MCTVFTKHEIFMLEDKKLRILRCKVILWQMHNAIFTVIKTGI